MTDTPPAAVDTPPEAPEEEALPEVDLVGAQDDAFARLQELKAVCVAACADADVAVLEIEPGARMRAVVAHQVLMHGPDKAVAMALGAGPFRLLSDSHVAEVTRVSNAVAQGQDAIKTAGAEPTHVALLESARQAHAGHGQDLAAAYAAFSAANRARVAAGIP
jgi:hypothetical protein